MNLLFVCTFNQMRSSTAEAVYSDDPRYEARSAGTAPGAESKITPELLRWADIVFAMEEKHEVFLTEEFSEESVKDKIVVLGIPDNYYFMEPELIELIKSKVELYLT